MSITVTTLIDAPRHRVWSIVTDIDGARERLSAITGLRVLERPAAGLIGLKWTETRKMFGREATETMWISAADPLAWYETEARSGGAIYRTRVEVADEAGGTRLSMSFTAIPMTRLARLLSGLAVLFEGAVRQAFERDLAEFKAAIERPGG